MANSAPIPQDKYYLITQACYSLALDIRNEPADVANHDQRVRLANQILRSPSNWPVRLAEIAEASAWGTDIDWATVSNAAVKTQISAIWNHVALAEYGETAEVE